MKTSDTTIELYKSFVKFQGEVTQPKKNAINPHFKSKYSTLDEIISTVKPILAKNKLAIIQDITSEGDSIRVVTRLIHESGEFVETESLTLKCERNNAQGQGSAITYGRRYSLSSILGISAEDDDDGTSAVANKETKKAVAPPPQKTQVANNGYEKISEAQAKRLFAISNGNTEIVKEIVQKYNYASTKDISHTDYAIICQEIEEKSKTVA